jgi:hypothetical protein
MIVQRSALITVLSATLGSVVIAAPVFGQSAAHTIQGSDRCPTLPKPAPPTDARRRAAHELEARAQETSIVADTGTTRDLYRRAAQLDPTDTTIAYALGRMYESARDVRAITEYCRFLLLAPDATEAADIRRRIAALSYDLVPRVPQARSTVAGVRRSALQPGLAFSYGVLFPGLGQYYTRRPLPGMLITAIAGSALYYALQARIITTSVTRTATDPFGNPYQYQEMVSHTERSHLVVGIGVASGASLLAAIEAYRHAGVANRTDTRPR